MKKPFNFTQLIAIIIMAVVTAWGGHFTHKPLRTHHRTAEGPAGMSETRKVSNAPIATLQYFLGLASGKLSRMSLESLFTATYVDSIEDIKSPGIFRTISQPSLPDGSSMRYNVILCLKAGEDLYLLTMTHQGSVAYAFLNNGKTFSGWNMLT